MTEKKAEIVELSDEEMGAVNGGLLPGFDEVEIDGGDKPKRFAGSTENSLSVLDAAHP